MFAHIAGIPVEEAALSFAPVAVVAGGLASARLRRVSSRRRERPTAVPLSTRSAQGRVPLPWSAR
jgi:hypothetical protein